MYDPIPGEASIVDNDVYLPTSKLCCLVHQLIDMLRIQHVAWDGNGCSTSLLDFLDHTLGFGCCSSS